MTGRKTTTRRTLLRLGAALLLLTALTGALGWRAFVRAHDSVPAVVEVSSAANALRAADRAAVEAFGLGGARLTGAGEEYRIQVAIAGQNLTQAAEDNVTGDVGSQQLRLVQGLVAVYSSSVEQAVGAQQRGAAGLGMVELWQASQLLHSPKDGILREIDGLRASQRQAGETTVPGVLSWAVPALLLLALLGYTQVYLARRFHRRTNPPLVLASGFVLVLVWVAMLTVRTEATLDSALDEPGAAWLNQAGPEDRRGQAELGEVLKNLCSAGTKECVETMAQVDGQLAAGVPPAAVDPAAVAAAKAELADADGRGGLAFLIPLSAALAMGLIVVGLYGRVDEYRFRAR